MPAWPRVVVVLAFAAVVTLPRVTAAQIQTVDVTLPGSVSFAIFDLEESTTGSPDPTSFTFSNAALDPGHALRVSVRAESSDFDAPGGPEIPASSVSWTTTSTQGGFGSNGNLSAVGYGTVFESQVNPTSGAADIAWTLDAPPAGIQAGEHTLVLRWRLESIVP
jgi:hypothetical protein